jgi:hypothetical protein
MTAKILAMLALLAFSVSAATAVSFPVTPKKIVKLDLCLISAESGFSVCDNSYLRDILKCFTF